MDKNILINSIVKKLKLIPNISAIVLGGSYATGAQRPDSDIDLGLYYREKKPFEIKSITKLANELNDTPDPLVSDFGGWGHWVNGGAWLTIKGQRLDFIYRNLDFVEKVIDNCINGIIESDYYQEPPSGFHSYTYCAEILSNKALYDEENISQTLKDRLKTYPSKLKSKIINGFLWDTEFSLSRARKFASRNEVYLVTSSLTRIAHDLTQVLYALNEVYFLSEKKTYRDIPKFSIVPDNYIEKTEKTLGNIGANIESLTKSLDIFSDLIEEFKTLSKDIYFPKYTK